MQKLSIVGKDYQTEEEVVGVGVKPATDFLVGVNLHKDGGVVVDEHLRAAADLYAAGDIAWFPSALTGERQRIEHWRTALQQGQIAARNMAGKVDRSAGFNGQVAVIFIPACADAARRGVIDHEDAAPAGDESRRAAELGGHLCGG